MMFFSKTTGGFYDSAIHGENIPVDAVEITPEQHAALLAAQSTGKRIEADANGAPVAVDPPPPSQAVIISDLSAAIQKRLDDFAKTRNYDSILSACTYSASTVPKFLAEGQYCVQARDATWAAAYVILEDVTLGQRPVPASIADFEAELPPLIWPA